MSLNNFSECLQESHYFIFKVEPGALATFTFSLECSSLWSVVELINFNVD